MSTGYTERDMILSLIKSDYGRSGGKCVTNKVKSISKESEVYKAIEKLTYSESAMGSGYGIHTNLDKNFMKHIGVVTELISRLQITKQDNSLEKYKTVYLRLLRSAYTMCRFDMALEICDRITGNNNSSIDNMYLLSRFSDAECIKKSYPDCGKLLSTEKLQEIADTELNKVLKCDMKTALMHKEAKEIICTCVNRLIVYLITECKVRKFGEVLTVYGKDVHGGEIDVITKDSIIDIKVKRHITVEDIMQILTYARVMKLNKHKMYKGVKYIKIVNPFNNNILTFTIKDIPKSVWELIDNEIISTYKQLSLFDEQYIDAMGDLSKIFG